MIEDKFTIYKTLRDLMWDLDLSKIEVEFLENLMMYKLQDITYNKHSKVVLLKINLNEEEDIVKWSTTFKIRSIKNDKYTPISN